MLLRRCLRSQISSSLRTLQSLNDLKGLSKASPPFVSRASTNGGFRVFSSLLGMLREVASGASGGCDSITNHCGNVLD